MRRVINSNRNLNEYAGYGFSNHYESIVYNDICHQARR